MEFGCNQPRKMHKEVATTIESHPTQRPLGSCFFLQEIIRHFATKASPLTDLLKKDAFRWSKEARLSFEDLNNALSNAPTPLCHDFSQPFIVEANASGKGLGAVLRQEHGVIAFESKKFNAKELPHHVYDEEMLAIMHTFKKWHQ